MSRQRNRERSRKRHNAQPGSNRNLIITAIVAALLVGIIATVIYVRNQFPANEAYPTVDGVSCDRGEHSDYHIHQHASIYINGKLVTVPANIGIASDSSCLYWIHTHSSDGIIHIEAPQDK